MFKGFYTVASGMFAQQRRTEMLTNNMANANTPGFKADQASLRAFPEMLLQKMDSYNVPTENGLNFSNNKTIGPINSGVYVQDITPKFLQGDLQQTDKKTDVSLLDVNIPANENGTKGSVFFTVQSPNGETRYTRNGNFTLDSAGFLTTGSGLYVLDEQGQKMQLANDQFSINDNGVLTGANGEQYRLGVGFANDPKRMIKEGDGLFRTEDGAALANAFTQQGVEFKTQQGFLERSNVDASRTMTDMLTAYRAFEANQKVLQAYDRSMEKAANEIGRVG